MKKVILPIALSFVSVFAMGQANPITFEEYQLENGLNVILHEDHSTPIVAVTVLYHVGSKNEDPKRTGFAHFFEHLLFEGSENIKRGEFMSLVQSNGGMLNANTSFDRTFYHEILPSNQLELGLWMEAERMLHAKIDEVGVETQREVVKEEYRQRYGRPYGTMMIEMFKRAFEEHPYRWQPIGSLAHLNEAKIDEFRDFYKTYYVPNNATLSIAGDFDKKQLKKWIDLYFSGIPRGTKEIYRPTIVEPEKHAEVRDVIEDNIQLPAVAMGYHIPSQDSKDAYAVDMLTRILSNGNSSRMQRNIVDQQQKAVAVGAFPMSSEHPSLAIIYGITNVGVTIEEMEKAMDNEIVRLQTELISEEEFAKLNNQVDNDVILANSTVEGIAESLANYKVYYKDANLINTEIERYKKVTREDIKQAANKYFRKDNRVVLHFVPKTAEEAPKK